MHMCVFVSIHIYMRLYTIIYIFNQENLYIIVSLHYLVVVTHFPEEDQELLMELHLFGRVGQISLNKRIV
jgi:hypothetical protein